MKLKGISVFEQHVEKVFAGLIFVALLGILAWQFLAGTATVTVNKAEVPLNEAWNKVGEAARGVQARLESTRAPEAADASEATREIVKFNDSYRGPLSPAKSLAVAIGETTGLGKVGGAAVSSVAPLAEIAVPAPVAAFGNSHLTLVSPIETDGHPEVAAVLPQAMPFDKAAVTVEATFPGNELLDALTSDPDGPDGPIRAMPRHWWDGSIQILDVELQRQELGADGQWSKQTDILPIPGRFSMRQDLTQPFDGAAQLKERARTATEFAEFIRRPPFYASAMGEKWISPAERREADDHLAAQAGTADEAVRLRRQVDGLRESLARVEQELAGLGAGGPRGPQEPPRRSPPPNPGGKGTGGGGGGGGGGGADRNQPSPDSTDKKRKGLEQRIQGINRDIAGLIKRLSAMGEDVSMYGPVDAAAVPAGSAGQTEAPLLENPAVRIWSHDVFVERGKVYRYRLVVVLNNPMFGQGNVMLPDQQEWSKQPVIRSAPSEWTDPIRVDDETYFFITSANPINQMNRTASARAEMFIFKWGRWRKGDVQLEPGDRLRSDIKYPDIANLIAQLPAGQPGNAPMPQPVAPPPPGGAGGGKRAPGEPPAPSPPPNPSQRDTRRPEGDPAQPPQGRPDNRPDPQGQGAKPAPLPMLTEKVAVDAIFLSVAAAQAIEAEGSSRSGMVAYLRDRLGEVVPRYPDSERGSIVRARLERSATQGQEDFQPNEPKPIEQPRPRKDPLLPKPPDGGGGGGGGGA